MTLSPRVRFIDAVEGSVSLRVAGEVLLARLASDSVVESRVVGSAPSWVSTFWSSVVPRRIDGADPVVLSYLANYLGRALFLAPEVRRPRLRALFVGWELEQLTASLQAELACADVIVTFSDYVAGVYRHHFPDTPVIAAPVCPPLPDGIRPDRARWDLPVDATLVVTVFDPVSGFDRKNPADVYRAFRQAFPTRDDVRLVVKVHGLLDRSDATATEGERSRAARFLDLCRTDPRVVLIHEFMEYRDVLTLVASCDVYVSLARAEGIGLPVLEAMSLGVATICSATSGHLDFVTEDSALLVPVTMVDIPADASGHYDPARYAVPPRWAQPDVDAAAGAMSRLADDAQTRASWGRRAARQARAFRVACEHRPWVEELLGALASEQVRAAHPDREAALRAFAAAEVQPWADHDRRLRRARRSLAVRTRLGRIKRGLASGPVPRQVPPTRQGPIRPEGDGHD